MSSYVSRAETGTSDPEEWQEGAARAKEARRRVADAVLAAILEDELTGSKDYVGSRLRKVAEAEREGDPHALRAACIDAAAAFGAFAVAIDISLPGGLDAVTADR